MRSHVARITRNRDHASQAQKQVRTAAPDPRALAPVELQPHPGLRDPWPVLAPVTVSPGRLELRDGAAGAALITGETHPHKPLMHDVIADRTVAQVDHLLDVRHERIDQPHPVCRSNGSPPASRSSTYLAMVLASTPASFAADQPRALRRVVRLQNLHDLSARLRQRPSSELVDRPRPHRSAQALRWTSTWRSRVRRPGALVSVSRDPSVRPPGGCRVRSHTAPSPEVRPTSSPFLVRDTRIHKGIMRLNPENVLATQHWDSAASDWPPQRTPASRGAPVTVWRSRDGGRHDVLG